MFWDLCTLPLTLDKTIPDSSNSDGYHPSCSYPLEIKKFRLRYKLRSLCSHALALASVETGTAAHRYPPRGTQQEAQHPQTAAFPAEGAKSLVCP